MFEHSHSMGVPYLEGGVSFWGKHETLAVSTGYQPEFSVKLDYANHRVILSGMNKEEIDSVSTFSVDHTTPDLLIPISQLGELPHELVKFYLLGSLVETDLQYEDVWAPNRTPAFSVLPDGYKRFEDRLSVLEIKTCPAGSRSLIQKVHKQYSRHSGMTKVPLVICFFGVAPREITKPEAYPISEESIKKMCDLVCMGKYIISECSKQGLTETIWARDSLDQIEIPDIELKDVDSDKLIITEEMVSAWSKLPALSDFTESLRFQARARFANPSQPPEPMDMGGVDQNLELLRFGPAVVELLPISTDSIYPLKVARAISNPIFRELACKYVVDQHKKIRIEGRLGERVTSSPGDYFRGLWGDCFNEGFNPFRVHKKVKQGKTELRVDPRFKILTDRVLETYGVSRKVAEQMRALKQEREIRKSETNLSPMDTDLAFLTSLLTEKTSSELKETFETVDGSDNITLPYYEETWYWHTRFWQRLVEEICVGRYSAQGDWNSFHVQRLDPFQSWIFTHGTGPDSHQFYYCIAKLKSTPRYSKHWESLGDGWWATTYIQSLKSDKITQFLNILEKLIMHRTYWDENLPPDRAKQHFCMSFLIAFDAKQSTIDTLSLFRYVYMELCKESSHRTPSKISSKIMQRIRTPLQQLVVSRISKLCCGNWGDLQMDEDSELSFSNLPSWIDWQSVPSFKMILSLSYMHYATSHPVSSGISGRIQIMGKVLREEMKLPADCTKIGWSSPSFKDIGEHEFSVGAVKLMAQYTSRRIKENYPVFESFMASFSERLRSLNFSDFATFKKSTQVSSKDPAARAYCFEEVSKLMDTIGVKKQSVNASPYQYINRLVDNQLSNPRNRNVSLFVKDQQTGLREIFVLTINLRILIKFMEVMSRMVNECLPNETLCRPERKRNLVISHQADYSKSRSALVSSVKLLARKSTPIGHYWSCNEMRFSSSSDAKTWCQQFCMPNFGVFQWELLEHAYGSDSLKLRKLLMMILNQITEKRLQIDHRVHEWFSVFPTTQSSSESFNLLKKVLNGEAGLLDKESKGIINRSNMMQGIPHETSSSLHAAYLMVICSQIRKLINHVRATEGFKHLKLGVPIITSMVSSDDSGILFGLPIMLLRSVKSRKFHPESIKELNNLRRVLTSFGWAIDECKPLFGARVSYEKSTIFAETPVFEFNSKFYVGSSISTAEIKFLTSQMTMGFHPKIQSRIEESLSSLSVALKEGINQKILHVLQICLNRMHMRFLYGGNTPLDLRKRLGTLSLPCLGWLPLVRKGLVGMFNNELMSDYLVTIQSPKASRYSYYSGRLDWGVSKDFSLHLKVASKYNEVCSRYGVNRKAILKLIAELEDGPSRFFSNDLTEEINIRLKLSKPGVRQTMSFVDLCKIFMASCYAAQTECIVVDHDHDKKRSLSECISFIEREPLGHTGTFIRNPQIEKMVEMLNSGMECDFLGSRKKTEGVIQLNPIGMHLGGRARDEIIESWKYGFTGYSLEVLNWAQAYEPRLANSLKETLDNFDGDVLLVDSALHKLDEKSKNVHCLVSKTGSHTLTDFMTTFLKTNWGEKVSLIVDRELMDPRNDFWDTRQAISDHVSTVSHFASCAAWGPSCFRKIFLKEMSEARDEWDGLNVIPRVIDFNTLVCLCSRQGEPRTIDLRMIALKTKRKIERSKDEYFVQRTGFWYRVLRDRSSGSWIVRRERGAIRQKELGNVQEEAEDSEFFISTTEISLVANLLHKRLEVRLKGAPSPRGQELSRCVMSQPLGPFNPREYVDLLHFDQNEGARVLALLNSIVLGNSHMENWDFWEKCYKEYVREGLPNKLRLMFECLLKAAQAQTSKGIIDKITGPDIPRETMEILIRQVENSPANNSDPQPAKEISEEARKLMMEMMESGSEMSVWSDEPELDPVTQKMISLYNEGSAQMNEDTEGLNPIDDNILAALGDQSWRAPDPVTTSGTNFWHSLRQAYARAYAKSLEQDAMFFDVSQSSPLPTLDSTGSITPIIKNMPNPWAEEFRPWNHYTRWQLAISTGDDVEYYDTGGIVYPEYLSSPIVISEDNPHAPGSLEFWEFELSLRQSRGLSWDADSALPEIVWRSDPYSLFGRRYEL